MSRFTDMAVWCGPDGAANAFPLATPEERQALATMLSMEELHHAHGEPWVATAHDLAVLKEGLDALRTAAVQPWGTGAPRSRDGVATAELAGATMRAWCAAMVLYLSGALDTMDLPCGGSR